MLTALTLPTPKGGGFLVQPALLAFARLTHCPQAFILSACPAARFSSVQHLLRLGLVFASPCNNSITILCEVQTLSALRRNTPYIPMPEGRGFTPFFR